MLRIIRFWVFQIIALAILFTGIQTASAADLLFKNENGASVMNNPSGGNPQFTIGRLYTINNIFTYHWNNGQGKPAGQISLVSTTGQKYGPWQATVVSKFYWQVIPNVTLPPGSYFIVDSDPASWSHNSASNRKGFAQVYGTVVDLNTLATFDDVKGRVNSFAAADRAKIIDTLTEDKKGPVQLYYGLRTAPTASADKKTARYYEPITITINNALKGYSYYVYPDTNAVQVTSNNVWNGNTVTEVLHFLPAAGLRQINMAVKAYSMSAYYPPPIVVGNILITLVP